MTPSTPAQPSQVVNGERQTPTSQHAASEATSDATTKDMPAEKKQEPVVPVTASSASTSTFRALAAVSYAERIRTSTPAVDSVARKAATPRDESPSNGKLSTIVATDGKATSSKRTGKSKAGSSSIPKRTAEASPTLSVSQGSGQGSGLVETPTDEAEQGWQEVTGKFKSHQSSKGDKKDMGNTSNTSGRQRQQAKKPIINGTAQDENTNHDRPLKGRSAEKGRKDHDRGDKESRHQQSSHEDGMTAEPTRRQQQQQKERDGSTPKSLGMKAASWRSSPLAAQTVSCAKQDLESEIPVGLREDVNGSAAPNSSSQDPAAERKADMTDVSGASLSTITTGIDRDTKPISGSATAAPEVAKSEIQPVSTAAPVNVWQLRKEKMKSTTAKQVKTSAGNGKTVFNTLSETVPASQSTNNNAGKKNSNRIEENQSKKLPAASASHANTQTSSGTTGKAATGKQTAKLASVEMTTAASGRRDAASASGPSGGSIKALGGPPPRLADDHLWPDIAASAAKLPGSTGIEGKKKDKEHDETARPAATSSKKEKKKWTPIPPAEMQEALDRAEKARKAALQSGVEGAKQKRRTSTSAAPDDVYQGISKTSTKKSPHGTAKAGGKAVTNTAPAVAAENSSRKAKVPLSNSSKQTAAVKSPHGIAMEGRTPVGLSSGLVPIFLENGRESNPSEPLNGEIDSTSVIAMDVGDTLATNERQIGSGQSVPSSSHGAEIDSPKRKAPVSDRPKGQPSSTSARTGGSTSTTNNHHVQMRDAGRGGLSAGRGGRGHGGKAARGGANSSGSKYADSSMAMSPRGHTKSTLLSPPPGAYNGLPFDSTLAAAVNAPGFVPYGGQAPYPYYSQGYYYGGNTNGTGVSSSGSDSGYEAVANAQQGGQQAFMPYNMAYMPQQRPVTEIPGLDTLRYYILGQIEYYFSIHNLCMDQFLKGQMDAHGWVDIPMIASFNRIRQVTTDEDLVQEVAQLSHILEVRDKKMRLRDNWQMWVFPNAKPSIFPETENTSATRLEELALHGVRVSDLSEETRERIVGDIQRDILRSTSGLASMTPAGTFSTETVIASKPNDMEKGDKATAKSSPETSAASDSSSDKLDIIV